MIVIAAVGCGDPEEPEPTSEAEGHLTRGPAAMVFDTGWRVEDHVRLAIDVNADHRSDLVGFGPDGVYVAQASGASFESPSVVLSDFDAAHGWHLSTSVRMLADVNGDGRLDLVGVGPLSVRVSLATATGTYVSPTVIWTTEYSAAAGWDVAKHALLLGDVNGDGKADLVGINDWGVYVSLSTGTSFAAKQMWLRGFSATAGAWDATRHVRLLADINHDGLADIIGFGENGVRAATSDGRRFSAPNDVSPRFGFSQGWRVGTHIRTVANVNGDAYPDLLGIGPGGVSVALGTGTGFGTVTNWSSELGDSTGWEASKHPRLIGDVDGDGLDDVVGIKDDHVYLAHNTGTGLAALVPVLDTFTSNAGWLVTRHPRMLADVDGDGQLDLVGFFSDAIYWDRLTPLASPPPADWDQPACAASRLGPPAPRTCEGPWQYSEIQRCVGTDASCPTACAAYKACPKWENDVVKQPASLESTNVVGSDTRHCMKTCNNSGCSNISCNNTITRPTSQCDGRASDRQKELLDFATVGINSENTFDSASAQAAAIAKAEGDISVTPTYPIDQFNFTDRDVSNGVQTAWDERYLCKLSVVNVVAKVAANDACDCQTTIQTACEHNCSTTTKYTEPGMVEPASPNITGQICMTHDDLPHTTQVEIRSKFDALWASYQGAPAPSVAAETFRRAMVSRLKLMYELFGDKLIDQHNTNDQVHHAISLYKDRPTDNPACALDIDAPTVPAGCSNPAVANTRGDLIRCQRLLGTHAAESVASLASVDCTALLTGYLGLKSQTADDVTCGGPHLRELGASTVLKLEDKQFGVINSAPTTLGNLARQLWLLDGWYAVSRAADAAGVFSVPDQQRRDTSFLLGQFWDRVRANTDADAQLEALSESSTPDQAEQALGLSAAASRGTEQSVVSALFTVPSAIQPENVTLTRPPLRGLPVLALVGDALKPLIDDLDGLAVYHDIACQFRDCRASSTNTPSRNAWKLIANLEATSLVNDVTATPSALAGWKPALAKLASRQSVFTQAVADAVTGTGGLAGASEESQVHPLARSLWVLYKHARAFRDHYEATGLFESTVQPQLQGSVLQQEQAHVVTALRGRATALSNRVIEYRNGLVAALQAQLAVMDTGARLEDLTNQRLRKAVEMDQKAANLEGLRAAGEDEEDAFGSLTASFADIQHALDDGAFVQVGDTMNVTLNGRSGKYTGSHDLATLSAQTVAGLVRGQMLVVQTSGSWSPTCSLAEPKFFGIVTENPLHVDLSNAAIGPEGYAITSTNGTFEAHSAGHAFGLEQTLGTSVKTCADNGATQVFGLEVEACVFAELKGTAALTTTSNDGGEARSTASFYTGLRLPNTPFPNAAVGSLLVVLANPTTGEIYDVKVAHSGGTSILVERPSTAYFIVNDKQCNTADNSLSLTVSTRTMTSETTVATKALTSMAEVLEYMRQQRVALVNQGALLPSQAALLRQQANLKLQAHLDEINIAALPGPLASLFDAFVTHQIVAVERQIGITAIERSLNLDIIDMRIVSDEIRAGAAHARLQRLVPQWLLRNLPHDTLRHDLVDTLSVSRDFLKPILELWYPHALDGVSFGPEISALLNADIDTSLVTLAGNGATFVNALLDAYDDATFGAKPPGAQLPVVVVNFHRPGFAQLDEDDLVWREADATRSRRVWDAIDAHGSAHFEISPEDFYSNNGGDAILPCTEVIPVIKSMEVYAVREDELENQVLNGFNRVFHGLGGVTQSFVAPEGPKVYELAGSLWQNFDLPVRYGIYELPVTTFLATPRQNRPIGLSANGTFDLDFSILNTLAHHGRFDSGEENPVTDIQLVMELDSRAVGTRPTWINRCR